MQIPNLSHLLGVELLFLPTLSLQDRQQLSTYLNTPTSQEKVFRTSGQGLLAHILCHWTISLKKAKWSQLLGFPLLRTPLVQVSRVQAEPWHVRPETRG